MPNGQKMTGAEHSDRSIIYNTPQESLRTGRTLNNSKYNYVLFKI